DKGYKKIAFVTTVYQIKIFNDRLKGYKAALVDNNLPVLEEHVIFGGLSIKDGRFGSGKLMRSKNKPDAIVAGDDFTALGVIKKLKEIDETPPEIGVIGFANEAFSAYITPNLSTIDQHPAQIGRECAKMFLKMVNQENPYNDIEHIVLDPTVVERQSTDKTND
ncbi:MAG: LacI family transcriptional regulator, partial [Sphingobacteriales bacterium]